MHFGFNFGWNVGFGDVGIEGIEEELSKSLDDALVD